MKLTIVVSAVALVSWIGSSLWAAIHLPAMPRLAVPLTKLSISRSPAIELAALPATRRSSVNDLVLEAALVLSQV